MKNDRGPIGALLAGAAKSKWTNPLIALGMRVTIAPKIEGHRTDRISSERSPKRTNPMGKEGVIVLLKDYFAICARYNASANDRIFFSVRQLKPELYYKPVLACSRSIHGILNHIIAADLAWIGEMTRQPSEISSPDQIVCTTREQLLLERMRVDAEMTTLIDQLGEEDLMAMIQYDDAAAGPMQWPFVLEVAHIFRHASHHRGQVTILMEALGVVPPKIDDLFVPSDISFALEDSGALEAC